MRRFAAAWRFLTVFPFPWFHGGDEGAALRGSAVFFPLVGVVLGLVAGAIAWGLLAWFPPMVVAALVIAVLMKVSMGLHLDGLADCGDALMSLGRDRARCLDIMKDSRIGAHGAMALVVTLLVKFACLSSAGDGMGLWGMAFMMPVGGRAGMLWPMGFLPYIRAEGLGKLFRAGWRECLFGSVVMAMGFYWFGGVRLGLIGLAWWLGIMFIWTLYLKKRLGGATGDCYGAACELGEVAVGLGFLCGVY